MGRDGGAGAAAGDGARSLGSRAVVPARRPRRRTLLMGTWEASALASDDAQDWLASLAGCGLDPDCVHGPLRAVLMASDPWLDARSAAITLAACEVVAALHRHGHASLPASAASWVAAMHAAGPAVLSPELCFALRLDAVRALDYVVTTSEPSAAFADGEAQGATAEDVDAGERWRAALDDLRERLSIPAEGDGERMAEAADDDDDGAGRIA